MTTAPVVGQIGLGAMGASLARNLQDDLRRSAGASESQHHLVVHNRTKAKGEALLRAGATWSESPKDVARQCDIIITMLSNDEALRDVFGAIVSCESRRPGAIFVDCSTVYPATTKELAAQAAEAGIMYLSCPIFGRPYAVLARKCIMVMSGPAEAKARVRPLIEPLGRAVLDVGEFPEQGSSMKLVGNFFISSAIELLAEGMTLGDAAGVGRDSLLQFLELMFPGIVFGGYGGRMAADDFDRKGGAAGFAVDMGIKDAGHIQRLADEHQVTAPVVGLVLEHLKEASARGRGDLDWGAIATVVREASGRTAGV